MELKPQPGPQSSFLASPADIAIYGGQAGGGKTYGLLLEPLRYLYRPGFGATIFRRTWPQIMHQGGLWDEATEIYSWLPGKAHRGELSWSFPCPGGGKSQVRFAHLQYEQDVGNYHGAQICLLGWDELTHFTERQFFYLLSRNRSICGVRPYCRATCNADADSWVADLIAWWLGADGFPIPERAGVLRWFVRIRDKLQWADTKAELIARFPGSEPLSLTFIPAALTDNQILMSKDPGYAAKLAALPLVEFERLAKGNWLIRAGAGKVFNRGWFDIVDAAPAGGEDCRYWDLASTAKKVSGNDPDFTAGVKMRRVGGVFYILDLVAVQEGPAEVESIMHNIAQQDRNFAAQQSARYMLRWEREPGSASVRESARLVQRFAGLDAQDVTTGPGGVPGDKVVRARGLAAQARAGNVKIVRGDWNEQFLKEMHGFPDRNHDDIPDAASGSFNALVHPGNVNRADGVRAPSGANQSPVHRAPPGVFRKPGGSPFRS